jgi:hypothetical protein
MESLTAWMIGLTVSICATVIAAGANNPMLHMAASGVVSLAFAVLAVRDQSRLTRERAPNSALAASTARYCGLIWGWGALGILATYALILERSWPEWLQFCIGFILVAAACLLFALLVAQESGNAKSEDTINKLGRALAMAQLVGMIIVLGDLLMEGKFPRSAHHPDWAANNIFFFGALAIAAISLNALLSSTKTTA